MKRTYYIRKSEVTTMNKRERLLTVLDGKCADRVPASFWFHFGGENAEGEACVKAHLDYYRDVDLDFIKIMSDGLNYPLSVKIDCAADWNQVKPLPRDHAFFTGTLERCRRINEELNGECCTFYNMFSPFNIVRERDVFTEHALAGRTWDQTVMAHLREDEEALKHAMDVIGEDLAYLAERILRETGCEGIYQSVQGAEVGRMSAEEYARIVAPSELKIIHAANAVRSHNILHMCSWAGNPNHLSYWKDYPVLVKNWGIGIEGLSLTQAQDFFPKGTILLGGMDNRRTHPLFAGTKEEIQVAVRAVLKEMEGKPFILGADCTVPPDTDRQHLKWIMEALRG